MAQELRGDRRCGGRFFAGSQCGYTLWFIAEFFGVCSKNFAQTFVAGAEPAAPHKERRGLDASGCGEGNLRGANFVSAYCTRWVPYAERSSRTELVQSPSAILLTFLDCSSQSTKNTRCLSFF